MLTGTKLEDSRKHNRRIIIETIRRNGPISRTEIAKMTGLTTATVSNMTGELLHEEIILEKGRRKGFRGQPAIELDINPTGRFSIGFEIGREQLSCVSLNLAGEIIAKTSEYWNHPSPKAAFALIKKRFNYVLEQTPLPMDRLLGAGVAVPGPFIGGKKEVISPREFPKWEEFPIAQAIEEALGFPAYIENDAVSSAIWEKFYGVGREYNDYFYIFLGTGLGGAMLFNGHPYQGYSPNIGELGWIRYGPKSSRSRVGNFFHFPTLQSALKRHDIDVLRPQELGPLFEEQNSILWQWLNDIIDCLGSVVSIINTLLGPEVIIFGGYYPDAMIDYLIERIRIENLLYKASQPDRYLIHQAKMLRASAGDLAPALGAAILPLYETLSAQLSPFSQTL